MNENKPLEEITLLTDKEWSMIDGEPCKFINYNDAISNLSKSVPYASITIECKKVKKAIKGFIKHKIDFMHLQKAFRERTIQENEEVIIFWSKRNYKLKLLRFLSVFFPKLRVMICPKGAFELMTNSNYKPELQGEARFLAEKPIAEWKPAIMK